jgi:serine/threonine protein kinase
MEFMDLGSLETMISVEKSSYPPETIQDRALIQESIISRFAWNILSGLYALHQQKQIHRDLKPDNILIESSFGLAKISDFGISKKLQSANQPTTQTYTGTLCYMSPERLENKEYSFSSDIWSLGIVIYEMATGEHPFQLSESAVEIQRFVE